MLEQVSQLTTRVNEARANSPSLFELSLDEITERLNPTPRDVHVRNSLWAEIRRSLREQRPFSLASVIAGNFPTTSYFIRSYLQSDLRIAYLQIPTPDTDAELELASIEYVKWMRDVLNRPETETVKVDDPNGEVDPATGVRKQKEVQVPIEDLWKLLALKQKIGESVLNRSRGLPAASPLSTHQHVHLPHHPGHQNQGHQNQGHQNQGHQNQGHQNQGHQNHTGPRSLPHSANHSPRGSYPATPGSLPPMASHAEGLGFLPDYQPAPGQPPARGEHPLPGGPGGQEPQQFSLPPVRMSLEEMRAKVEKLKAEEAKLRSNGGQATQAQAEDAG